MSAATDCWNGDDICIRFSMVNSYCHFLCREAKSPFELRVCQPCLMGSPLVMTVTRPRKYLPSPKQVFNEVFLSSLVPFMALLLSHSGPMLELLRRLCDCMHKFSCHVSNGQDDVDDDFCLVFCLFFSLLFACSARQLKLK